MATKDQIMAIIELNCKEIRSKLFSLVIVSLLLPILIRNTSVILYFFSILFFLIVVQLRKLEVYSFLKSKVMNQPRHREFWISSYRYEDLEKELGTEFHMPVKVGSIIIIIGVIISLTLLATSILMIY